MFGSQEDHGSAQPTSLTSSLERIFAAAASPSTSQEQDPALLLISEIRRASHLIESLSLFSENDTLEDLPTSTLRVLLLQSVWAEIETRVRTVPGDVSARKERLSNSKQHYTTFVKCLFDLEVLPPATTSATPASTPLQLLSNLLRPYVAANQAASSSSSSSSPSVAKSQNAQQRRELKVTLFKLERAVKNALDEYRSAARSKATTSLGGGLLATSSGLSNGITGASSAVADGPEEPQWDLLVLPKRKSGGQEEREEDDDDEDEDTSSAFVSGLGGSSARRSGSTGQASSIETPQSLRSYLLLLLRFHALMAYNNLSFVDDELGLLANVPASAQRDAAERQAREEAEADRRRRRGEGDVDDFRVETRFDASAPGPLMDDKGKPLRPFTITSGSNAPNGNGSSAASFSNAPFRDFNERQRMRDGVFQPSHRLPTMTIDEYLEEEQRRGNVITGGGAEGAAKATPKEERASRAEMEGSRGAEEAEEEIRKEAIEWDEFKESNKRGAGNTMNRG